MKFQGLALVPALSQDVSGANTILEQAGWPPTVRGGRSAEARGIILTSRTYLTLTEARVRGVQEGCGGSEGKGLLLVWGSQRGLHTGEGLGVNCVSKKDMWQACPQYLCV